MMNDGNWRESDTGSKDNDDLRSKSSYSYSTMITTTADEKLEQMQQALSEAEWMVKSEKHDKEALIKANRELQIENDNLVSEIQCVIEETQELEAEALSHQKLVEHWKDKHNEVSKERDALLDAMNEQNLKLSLDREMWKHQELEEKIQQVRMEERCRIKLMFAEYHRLEEEMEQIKEQKAILENEVERLQKLLLLTEKANDQQRQAPNVSSHDSGEPLSKRPQMEKNGRRKRHSAPEFYETENADDRETDTHNIKWLETAKEFFTHSSSFSAAADRSNDHLSNMVDPREVHDEQEEGNKGISHSRVSRPLSSSWVAATNGARPPLRKSESSRTIFNNTLLGNGNGESAPRWSLGANMIPRLRQSNTDATRNARSCSMSLAAGTPGETKSLAAPRNRRRGGRRRSSIDDNGFETVRAAAVVAAGSLNYLPESWTSDESESLPACTPLQINSESSGTRSLRDALSKEASFRRTSAMTDAAVVAQAIEVEEAEHVETKASASSDKNSIHGVPNVRTKATGEIIVHVNNTRSNPEYNSNNNNDELSLADVLAECNLVNARESRRRSQIHAHRTSFIHSLATLHSLGQLSESNSNMVHCEDNHHRGNCAHTATGRLPAERPSHMNGKLDSETDAKASNTCANYDEENENMTFVQCPNATTVYSN